MIKLTNKCFEIFPVIVPEKSSLKTINFYLVKQANSLSLIDAGWNNEKCWTMLNNVLTLNGLKLNDITEIILTHHHQDHIGLVNRIVSQHQIPVYSSPDSIPRLKREENFLEMRINFYQKLYQEMGCGITGEQRISELRKAIVANQGYALEADIRAITEKQLVNFSVINTPGHAPDQLAFFEQNKNWLFAGDLLLEHISSNALVEPDAFGNRLPSLTQHLQSLKNCMEMDVEMLFPGHGSIIKHPNHLIKKRIERAEIKGQRLMKMIQTGIATASEIASSWYKNTYYEQFSLVMSEIIGHLDFLESQNKIEKELFHGVWHYRLAV